MMNIFVGTRGSTKMENSVFYIAAILTQSTHKGTEPASYLYIKHSKSALVKFTIEESLLKQAVSDCHLYCKEFSPLID